MHAEFFYLVSGTETVSAENMSKFEIPTRRHTQSSSISRAIFRRLFILPNSNKAIKSQNLGFKGFLNDRFDIEIKFSISNASGKDGHCRDVYSSLSHYRHQALKRAKIRTTHNTFFIGVRVRGL